MGLQNAPTNNPKKTPLLDKEEEETPPKSGGIFGLQRGLFYELINYTRSMCNFVFSRDEEDFIKKGQGEGLSFQQLEKANRNSEEEEEIELKRRISVQQNLEDMRKYREEFENEYRIKRGPSLRR